MKQNENKNRHGGEDSRVSNLARKLPPPPPGWECGEPVLQCDYCGAYDLCARCRHYETKYGGGK